MLFGELVNKNPHKEAAKNTNSEKNQEGNDLRSEYWE